MILTGGKRSTAVLAVCEKRRSGLAPSTTQGPGTKTESSIFGMPTQQLPPGSLPYRPSAVWTGLLARRCALGGRGLSFLVLLTLSLGYNFNQEIKSDQHWASWDEGQQIAATRGSFARLLLIARRVAKSPRRGFDFLIEIIYPSDEVN